MNTIKQNIQNTTTQHFTNKTNVKKGQVWFLNIVVFACFFSISSYTYSQNIKGTIINENQEPIEGVYVHLLKNGEHTHSDIKGNFHLQNIKLGDSIIFSHIGYEKQIVSLKNYSENLNILLVTNTFSLNEIQISPKLDALNLFSEINIKTIPVNSSQEILRNVPGLFIGQHAGGGKAEQIFLRGFDIDHGTDINISVDGLPVNMVSHAHGQGYADLHFVIPETIEKIDFGKGCYNAEKGNFTTAGYVEYKTKDRLQDNILEVELGQFNSQRTLGMFNILNNAHNSAYLATEYISTDGYFVSPQHFNRINIMSKYTGILENQDKISVLISHFSSSWDASGQIPQRAIEDGSISRFGAIDDTEGGNTGRTNFLLKYNKHIDNNTYINSTAYFCKYDFELYSNFTFFLNDSINGDQIKQKENRDIFGWNSEFNKFFTIGSTNLHWQIGAGLRNDISKDNELSQTADRINTISIMKLGDINETNFNSYTILTINLGKWSINPSVRFDYFKFMYYDKLITTYNNKEISKSIISPKLNILYNPSNNLQLYLKSGKGFHSNDTRVVIAQDGNKILPAAYSSDLGFIWKPNPKIVLNIACWFLHLEQEFVYVGDEGVVEPSGKTNRSGIDFSSRYQLFNWLFWSFDTNYTYARAIEEPVGSNYIPLAPDFTIVSGINIIHPSNFYGGINLRYLKNRPANEDNSIIAQGYTVVDCNAGYQWKNIDFSLHVQNLLNEEWNETQFATNSRLQHEISPFEEIHFTPGTPFFIKGKIKYIF